ncbi:DsbA family protein [Paenibacillus sp. MBLB2552]|uniref:DsbA family protein n=1 Tax=Paenibacillus mellifer TaxID=2937794 RepID=A0A9X2BNU6_9BACL|nr:thioredoxin domain-containing protein [Paenibacillus mellifer]MCK8487234.1 DsbA family protein [Paenibacillus mellifer]
MPNKKNSKTKRPSGKKATGKAQAGSAKFVITLIAAGIVVLAAAVLLWKNGDSAASGLNGLPNYTEIRGDYDAEGLKYEKQPHLGRRDAPVKVIEFADFKCPACQKWEETYMERFQREYLDTGKAELYFMNFAFIDRDSIMAAGAGEAIYAQSNEKFWEFKRKLYEHQGDETQIWATPAFLLDFVKGNMQGIDFERFQKDLTEHAYLLPVKEDFKTAGNYGVNGTPQFMVNGKLLSGSTYEELAAAIDAQLP